MKGMIGLLLLFSFGFSPEKVYRSMMEKREKIRSYHSWGRIKAKNMINNREKLYGFELTYTEDRFRFVLTEWGDLTHVFVGKGDSIYSYDPRLGRLKSVSTKIGVLGPSFGRNDFYEVFLGIPDSSTKPESSYIKGDSLVLFFSPQKRYFIDKRTGAVLRIVKSNGEVLYYGFKKRGGFLRPDSFRLPGWPSELRFLLDFEEINPSLTEEDLNFIPFPSKARVRRVKK